MRSSNKFQPSRILDLMTGQEKELPGVIERFSRLERDLLDVNLQISHSLELREAESMMGSAICDAFGCGAVAIISIDEQYGVLLKKTFSSKEDEWFYQSSVNFDQGIIGKVIASGETLLITDPESHPAYIEAVDGVPHRTIKSLLCAPVDEGGGIVELINFQGDQFSQIDEILIALAAPLIGNVLGNFQGCYDLRVLRAELEASGWELKRSRNILRSLFDNMPSSVYIIDETYKLIALNLARAARAGSKPAKLAGKFCYGALYGRDEPCEGCLVTETFNLKKVLHRKIRLQEGGDEVNEWDIHSYPITNEQERVVQAILMEEDITEKRRLEAILAQSEKLAAIGQLSAGLAHEINNPLTVILANAQILEREMPDNEDWREAIELIIRAGSRSLQVVRNLLGFARKEEYSLAPTDINENIQRALELIQHEVLARSVSLEFLPGKNIPPVMASGDHLQGVWLNIVLNALDATDPHGDGIIKVSTFFEGTEVLVKVEDNGNGIPPDRLERIFEPFYTTKEPGRERGGTGLGLSVSHRIVKQHGGEFFVESEVGTGTIFMVSLPAFKANTTDHIDEAG